VSQPVETVVVEVLSILQLLAAAAAGAGAIDPEVGAGGQLATVFLQIAQQAIVAHEKIQGQPIDLSLLTPVPPAG
jgi:hypothetical protein